MNYDLLNQNKNNTAINLIKLDLESNIYKLVKELEMIADTGTLPDGDHVDIPVQMWASKWFVKLNNLQELAKE